jgi:alpha-tubulin suppressor-like RCC1 family protein
VVGWGHEYPTDSAFQVIVPPAGLTGVTAISAGYYHSLALRSDGTVAAWGANDSGQSTAPAGLSNVRAIAAGGNFSLALRSDGSVAAWGSDDANVVTYVSSLSRVSAIDAGGSFAVAILGG